MTFESLNLILDNKAQHQALKAARIVFEAQKVLGGRGRALKVINDTLYIAVDNSVQASEIEQNKEEVLALICREIKPTKITNLRYKVG